MVQNVAFHVVQISKRSVQQFRRDAGKKEILVRVILVTENLDPEILDPENLVLGNFKPRNPSAWKGQCMEISEP